MRQLVVMAWLVCMVAVCGSIAVKADQDSAGTGYGGITETTPDDSNSFEMYALARFAVSEYNKQKNVWLEFVSVKKVMKQVVAGIMYHLTIEADDGTTVNLYLAKIWVKPWLNFQKLEDFKLADRN